MTLSPNRSMRETFRSPLDLFSWRIDGRIDPSWVSVVDFKNRLRKDDPGRSVDHEAIYVTHRTTIANIRLRTFQRLFDRAYKVTESRTVTRPSYRQLLRRTL